MIGTREKKYQDETDHINYYIMYRFNVPRYFDMKMIEHLEWTRDSNPGALSSAFVALKNAGIELAGEGNTNSISHRTDGARRLCYIETSVFIRKAINLDESLG